MTANKDLVAKLYADFGNGDPSGFVAALADDVVLRIHGPAPHAGQYAGKPAFLEVMGIAGKSMLEEKRTIEKIVGDGDTVVVIGEEEFTIAPTGKRVKGRFAHHLTFRGDSITLFEDFEPTGAGDWV